MIKAYPDLQGGRFVVIADFEDPRQMELFQLISVSDEAKCVLDPKRGRARTGAGCLLFTAGSSNDTVVLNNANSTNWYLKRDWRPFDLLLMSVHAPEPGLALEITVAGGPPQQRRAAGATVPLREGWTVARVDLAQIGEGVPLDDVREMRLAVTGSSRPVRLPLDDIVLTRCRNDLFGDSMQRGAGLYVQQVGRRWRIGAKSQSSDFELTFANGRIVEWYNLAADPNRLRNLVRGTTLGPTPTVVGSADANERDFMPLGRAVLTRSRIVEMSVVRAVVTCEWRFVDDPEADWEDLADRPFQRWVYTIYPTGQIYVAVEATVGTKSWTAPPLGLAVALTPTDDDRIQTHVTARPDSSQADNRPVFATARSAADDAFLLYVVDHASRTVRTEDAAIGSAGESIGADHVSLVAVGGERDGDVPTWACHIFVGSSSKVSDDEALMRAVSYAMPTPPDLEHGTLVTGDGGGLDVADGCYVLTPDRGRVRLVIDGARRPLFSPRFRIVGADPRKAWVYVDDVILDRVARDAAGNLIFQLPGAILRPTIVDVLFGNR